MNGGIAVVGLSAWYPCGSTLKEFWTNVVARRRAFRRLPERRLSSEYQDSDPLAPDKTYLTRAAVLDGFTFDWARRRIPKSVFDAADMVNWLALEMAIRAIEDAGYDRTSLPREKTGVIIGNTLTGEIGRACGLRLRWPYVARAFREGARALGYGDDAIHEVLSVTEDVFKSAFPDITEDTLPGVIPNTIAGRICNYFDLKGGGYAVDGACASSLIALAQAADALTSGKLDLALAGGIDVSIDPFETVGFAKIGALARDEMYVYEQRSQGFLPGEGCGWALLKRAEDAQRDGDYTYAVLKGWGVSSDGRGGLTAPSVEGQALALKRAYELAGYALSEVDFVEGHGTGTAVGDATELSALAATLADTNPTRPIGVTSLKSLVGHTKAAAGIGSFIKTVLAVNQRVVPPLAGCERPHPVFEAESGAGLYPILDGRKQDTAYAMRAGVSTFGFGGINVHATVESAAPPHPDLKTDIDERALFVSAQDSEVFFFRAAEMGALRDQIEPLAAIAGQLSLAELTDLSAHLAQVARDGPLRAALVAANPDELARKLATLLNLVKTPLQVGQVLTDPLREIWLGHKHEPGRVGFLFPGQGSQQLNMARWLVERFNWARELVAEADAAVGVLHGLTLSTSIWRALYARAEQLDAFRSQLTQTEVCQPAICLASVLFARHLMRLGVRPQAVGGHSLGELTAFWAAGALSDRDLFALARLRGESMAAVDGPAGSMASLRCSKEEATNLCEAVADYVVIANINSDRQVAVSGDPAAIDAVLQLVAERGIQGQRLPVGNAFHSRHIHPGAARLARESSLQEVVPELSARLFSGLDGREVRSGDALRSHFPVQMVEQVDFVRLGAALSHEVDLLIEVGPGRVLSGLLGSIAAAAPIACLPVEPQPGRHQHFNQVLAATFAHGVELDLELLFEQRHYAAYVSPTDRQFIINPCEQDLAAPFIPDSFDRSFKCATGAETRPAPVIQRAKHLAAPAPAMVEDIPRGDDSADVQDVLIDLLVARTGFPRDTIRPEMTFLNDLNIESIGAGEIIAKAGQAAGLTRLDPSSLLQASIADVADAIRAALRGDTPAGQSPVAGGHDAGGLLDALGRLSGHPTWVRTFALEATEEPLPARAGGTPPRFAGRCVLIACEDVSSEHGTAIARAFAAEGAATATVSYADLTSGVDSPPDVLIAVLPTSEHTDEVQAFMQLLRDTASASRLADGALVFVQFGGPFSAHSFAASLHHERSRLRVRVLDLDPTTTPACLGGRVVDETATDESFAQATYTVDGVRRVRHPVLLDRTAGVPRRLRWSREDVVLVTGGGRGFTAQLALAMAETTGARMVLIGRGQSDELEIAATLERFGAAGAECHYVCCDVTDAESVSRTVSRVQTEIGPITAVLHGAGINRPALLGSERLHEAFGSVAPKVLGLTNVLSALGSEHRLKLVVGLSSIIGVTGMHGNAWYGFANEVMDLLLSQYRRSHPDTGVLSIAYSLIDAVGMGAKLAGVAGQVRRMGTSAIPVAEASEQFLHLLEHDYGTHHVVVAARLGGLDTWRPSTGSQPAARFLEDIATLQPRVELAARTHLSLERDAYLLDHVYKGTYLFPMVFGLEAMGQAVAGVLGRSQLDHVRIENLELRWPIVVDAHDGEDILVHAEVLEPDAEDPPSERRVAVGVACRRSGFAQDHFSATFVVADAAVEPPLHTFERPSEPLTIDPRRDLYGRFLFHGPRFQRLQRFYVLRSDYYVFDSLHTGQPIDEQPVLLGDPFFRDSLMQACQVVISQDRGLPRSIKALEVFTPSATPDGPLLVEGVVNERTDEHVDCTITVVDQAGRVLQRLEHCRFSILEHLSSEPTAEEIAAPDERDQRRVEENLRAAAAALRVRAPALVVANLPGVQALPAAERHSREHVVLQRAIELCSNEPPTRLRIEIAA